MPLKSIPILADFTEKIEANLEELSLQINPRGLRFHVVMSFFIPVSAPRFRQGERHRSTP